MKLLVDMNLSPRWVGVLADGGIGAAHWSTLGAKNAPDVEIMIYAEVNGYVVLTHSLTGRTPATAHRRNHHRRGCVGAQPAANG